MSTNFGVAPTYKMQLVEATNENGVVITSSPGPIPAAIIAQCNPVVPDETPMPNRRPDNSAHAFSNSTILGPIESVEVCITSTTASISNCVISGEDKGIAAGIDDLLWQCHLSGTAAIVILNGHSRPIRVIDIEASRA